MVSSTRTKRFPRQDPGVYIAAFALLAFFPMILSPAFDLGQIFYFMLFAPFIALVLLGLAIYKRSFAGAAVLATFCGVAWLLFLGRDSLRDHARWILWSRPYKAQALSQPTQPGELQHTLWDGWGFAGMDTDVFLVFDPKNSLAAPAASHRPGKFGGIPCPVYTVRRLSDHWYSVYFYTDTSWNACP